MSLKDFLKQERAEHMSEVVGVPKEYLELPFVKKEEITDVPVIIRAFCFSTTTFEGDDHETEVVNFILEKADTGEKVNFRTGGKTVVRTMKALRDANIALTDEVIVFKNIKTNKGNMLVIE